jgi:predicted enzyme related to lactoylglutathione lyase
LHTRAYEPSLEFYRAVFGWSTRVEGDSPELRYSTLDVDGEQHAGVMDASGFLPDGVRAGWTVYFGVDDADQSLSHVVALGGAVVVAAEDTPYGRVATVADPTGAVFRLHQPPAG